MLRYLLSVAQGNMLFAIDPVVGLQLVSLAERMLSRQIPVSSEPFMLKAAVPNRQSFKVNGVDEKNRSYRVAVIRAHGVMTMYDEGECGEKPGMETLHRWVSDAIIDPDVDAVVLDTNSPGGEARYIDQLSAAVANSPKPVVAWVSNMATSAAYWLANSADEIMLSGALARVGSIGTRLTYLDATRQLKAAGIDLIDLVATDSPNKNRFNFFEPSDEDRQLIVKEFIDPTNKVFMDMMQQLRPSLTKEKMDGSVWQGQSAIDAGIADSIGSLQDAIIRAATLAANIHNNPSHMNQNEQGQKMHLLHQFASFLGFGKVQLTAEETSPASDTPQSKPAAPPVAEADPAPPTQENPVPAPTALPTQEDEAPQQDLTQLQQQISAQAEEINRLKAEIVELSKEPAALRTETTSEHDETDPLQAHIHKYNSSITAEALKRFPVPAKA